MIDLCYPAGVFAGFEYSTDRSALADFLIDSMCAQGGFIAALLVADSIFGGRNRVGLDSLLIPDYTQSLPRNSDYDYLLALFDSRLCPKLVYDTPEFWKIVFFDLVVCPA